MQLHDKTLVSTETLLSAFDIDYDQEVMRLREEQITSGKGGQINNDSSIGGPAGGSMGMDMGMGMGSPPGGGGMDLGIGGSGGMPAGLSQSSPAPPGGPPPVTAMLIDDLTKTAQLSNEDTSGNRVFKRGKRPKGPEVSNKLVKKDIFLTKPEQKLYSIIKSLNFPFRLFAQYEQKIHGSHNAYMLDFAFPDIMVNFEADGEFWHSDTDAVEKDKQRDIKLASIGWRVVRIKESALNTKAESVTEIIINNVKEAILQRQAMSKNASITDNAEVYYEDAEDYTISYIDID